MSRAVVSRALTKVEAAGVPVIGLVSNMTEYVCPDCDARHPLFPGDGAERLARESGVEIWARVPFDPRLGATTDRGWPMVLERPGSAVALEIEALADRVQKGAMS